MQGIRELIPLNNREAESTYIHDFWHLPLVSFLDEQFMTLKKREHENVKWRVMDGNRSKENDKSWFEL